MNFLEIIKHPATNLPISYNASFRETIRDKFQQFGEMIDKSDNLTNKIGDTEFNPKVFKDRNKILRDGILKAIDTYYEGDPSGALKSLTDCIRLAGSSGYLNLKDELIEKSNLYRIRISKENYALHKTELFHIPFNLRGKVKTQRYSIPGLPSLYVANSIYVAWEEMRRPVEHEMQAVRLSNTRTLKLMDLTTDIYSRNSHLVDNTGHHWTFLYKVMIWPLLAACSVKVKNTEDAFKPEYIIPQLLLQWVNNNEVDGVDGIKYSSTHIDFNEAKHYGTGFYNIVIPVRSFDRDSGQCPVLLKLFKSTQVLPMQIRQFAVLADRLLHQPSIDIYVNPDVESIELIKGYTQSYSKSTFGVVEHILKGINLEDFDI